jgi:hypothetical protein
MKNEAPYLPEWIEYHLIVGIEDFFLVDNNSTDGTAASLRPSLACGIVTFGKWPGFSQQFIIYNHYIQIIKDQSYWIAVIDVDEFMVPLEGRSVPDILRSLQGAVGVTVNWVTDGGNGIDKHEPGLVIERFHSHFDWLFSRIFTQKQ